MSDHIAQAQGFLNAAIEELESEQNDLEADLEELEEKDDSADAERVQELKDKIDRLEETTSSISEIINSL